MATVAGCQPASKFDRFEKPRDGCKFDFFEKLDVDNDGFVDRGEADEFFKMMGLPTGKEEL